MAKRGTAERTIAGRYDLGSPLGRGAMGTVWRARDRLLEREVALKEILIPASLSEKEHADLSARVLREARAAARLGHAKAVTVFDVVEEDGNPWIVMEVVDAPTLEEVVEREGMLDVRRAAAIGLEILGALEAAHELGIVHRDVKPANVMVLPHGGVKLADFGIATLKDDPKITATGMVLGSPSYMSPEQAQSSVSSPASDLWSLGAVLYFAVEGRPPFDKGAAIPTLTAVVGEEPPPASRAGSLEPVIAQLLSKDPKERPSGEVLRRMLQGAAGTESQSASTEVSTLPVGDGAPSGERTARYTNERDVAAPVGVATAPVPETAAPVPETTAPTAQPSPAPAEPGGRRGRLVAALALVVLVALGIAVALATNGDEASSDGTRRDRAAAGAGQEQDPVKEAPAEEDPEPAAEAPVGAEDWVSYEDPATGYRISYPPGWDIRPVDDTRTDFVDPDTGMYLRVDWTDTPGDDPLAAWEEQSDAFGASHSNYQELGMSRTTYKGFDAALWEYSYTDGVDLHAVDLGFVTGDYGFALNFQTHAEDWEGAQPIFESFKEAFVPPSD